jgi:hypothetical protein
MEVLTVGPEEIPHLLAVYEIEAASPQQAVKNMYAVSDKLGETSPMGKIYLEGGAAVYLQMSDVASEK